MDERKLFAVAMFCFEVTSAKRMVIRLEARFVTAVSEEEAEAQALHLLTTKFPEGRGYTCHKVAVAEIDPFNESSQPFFEGLMMRVYHRIKGLEEEAMDPWRDRDD